MRGPSHHTSLVQGNSRSAHGQKKLTPSLLLLLDQVQQLTSAEQLLQHVQSSSTAQASTNLACIAEMSLQGRTGRAANPASNSAIAGDGSEWLCCCPAKTEQRDQSSLAQSSIRDKVVRLQSSWGPTLPAEPSPLLKLPTPCCLA